MCPIHRSRQCNGARMGVCPPTTTTQTPLHPTAKDFWLILGWQFNLEVTLVFSRQGPPLKVAGTFLQVIGVYFQQVLTNVDGRLLFVAGEDPDLDVGPQQVRNAFRHTLQQNTSMQNRYWYWCQAPHRNHPKTRHKTPVHELP